MAWQSLAEGTRWALVVDACGHRFRWGCLITSTPTTGERSPPVAPPPPQSHHYTPHIVTAAAAAAATITTHTSRKREYIVAAMLTNQIPSSATVVVDLAPKDPKRLFYLPMTARQVVVVQSTASEKEMKEATGQLQKLRPKVRARASA